MARSVRGKQVRGAEERREAADGKREQACARVFVDTNMLVDALVRRCTCVASAAAAMDTHAAAAACGRLEVCGMPARALAQVLRYSRPLPQCSDTLGAQLAGPSHVSSQHGGVVSIRMLRRALLLPHHAPVTGYQRM